MSLALLQQVNCATPFSLLGWQPLEQGKATGLLLRVYLPHATAVTALSADGKKALGELTAVSGFDGVFELKLSKKRKAEAYILQVQAGNYQYQLFDPYQFKDEAYYAVHYVTSQPENLYRQLGAQLIELDTGTKKNTGNPFCGVCT